MKKLALSIEELTVETFFVDSDETGPQTGTVEARSYTIGGGEYTLAGSICVRIP
jgi:hypothetical protein